LEIAEKELSLQANNYMLMMLNRFLKIFHLETLRSKSGVALVIVAVLFVEVALVAMYWFARERVREDLQRRAEMVLELKDQEINRVMAVVESAYINFVWAIERGLADPDSLSGILRQAVIKNKDVVGTGLVFDAHYYPDKGRWYEPYILQREDGTLVELQLGGPEHDYFKSAWWKKGQNSADGFWSEPYYDELGAKTMLATYFEPVYDASHQKVALFGADIPLEFLSKVINAYHYYSSSAGILISQSGQLMVYPDKELILHSTIQEITAEIKDSTASYISQQMLAGKSGHGTFVDNSGDEKIIFYCPIKNDAGWSMAIVCDSDEIYSSLLRNLLKLQLLMFVGFAMMGLIIWRTIVEAGRLDEVQRHKERISSELHIANNIQQSMLPKVFPPFPDRNDIDVYAILTPAREVGGDLYDFYIRDEKLFFCIGDVAGKGVPASLIVAIVRTVFRNVSEGESLPHHLLTTINNTLFDSNPDDLFVTFFVGVLDLPTGRLRYSNAGHEAPILLTADTKKLLPCDSNLPLGVMPDWKYTLQETLVSPETTLFLYTDGLTEAMNDAEEVFGKKRMNDALHFDGPRDVIDKMTAAVRDYVGSAVQSDDLTMLTIRYARQQRALSLSRSLTLPNDVQTVPQLTEFVEGVCQDVHLDEMLTMQINLAVEEAVVNVMNYAYPQGKEGIILIEAAANDERLKFVITDSGMPFDPTTRPKVDTSLPVDERPIGGLGIHLIRHYMDSINYERIGGQNVLTLRKNLHEAAADA